jgi:3'-5' exonuclease
MTRGLKALLECTSIIKSGVGIAGDGHKLSLEYSVQVGGVMDINVETNRRVQPGGVNLVEWTSFTLAEQCERLLRLRLPKPQDLRCGNWEQVPLSAEQKHYASLDAFASLLVGRAVLKLPLRTDAEYAVVQRNGCAPYASRAFEGGDVIGSA